MKKSIMLIVLSFLLLFAGANNASTGQAKEKPQVIVLFVEGMSFFDLEQLQKYPHVDKWIRQAGAGAVSIRSPGARNAPNGYLLMGSGAQAVYTERSGTGYHPWEAVSAYETAGERAQELSAVDEEQKLARSSIVFPGIFRLLADNQDKPYSPQIGMLGKTLTAHHIPVAVYGTGDYEDIRQRHSVLFAMDEQGRVSKGDLSKNTVLTKRGSPYGIQTNYEFLLQQVREDSGSGLITVQLSDLSRLYQMADEMDPIQFERQYHQVLSMIGAFLDKLLDGRGEDQQVMLLSPAVNVRAAKEKALLPPVLVWGGNETGLVTSATTRQSGLISGLDILPTILAWLDVPTPKGLTGHAVRIDSEKNEAQLVQQIRQIHHTYATRSSVLYSFVMLQIITLACAAILWMVGKRVNGVGNLERLRRGVRLALLSMLCFPVLLLLEGFLEWEASGPVVLGVLIVVALLAAFWLEQRTLAQTTAIVCGVTVLCLLVDGWTGATLMRRSYLGYDPVIGARFYGLGNEYEGVMIGSAIMFVASWYQMVWQRMRPFLAAMVFAIVLYYMVAPGLGTDAGGFLAGLVGFFVAFSRLQGWTIGKKGLLLLTGGLMIGIVTLIVGSLLTDQPLTHIGRVSQQIVTGQWDEVGRMVERKIAMNVRLIRVSIWSKVFVVSLIVLGLLALWNDRFLRHLAMDTPFLVKGFSGVIAGSLAGLVLNDSGIVTAATCIIFLVVPALYAALGEPKDEQCST
ncbi:hypothetical protein AN963_28485 [Brevibacillus choshinensis]|uniref:Phosphoglyceromutase n=1 Tax=Brevibacillus choshinensis TaxID=54911 RepID=A0ABR5MZ71_BRECH|nr:hypothetical protein [Brevibacillus choshinensis]KQL43400.1 hypothetical protein AN963_28485 [Brevibacillus choshinensis]